MCLLIVFFLVLMEISNLLNTGLDSETLVLCVKLCEAGVNPEALASVIEELRRESAAIKVADMRIIIPFFTDITISFIYILNSRPSCRQRLL